jgi:uncharacterized protein DUF3147
MVLRLTRPDVAKSKVPNIVPMILRFLAGGAFVSAFAVLGTSLKPKSFAGLFGASPAIALATLLLTARTDGAGYAATEARSGIIGALAFCGYACCVSRVLANGKTDVKLATYALLTVWLIIAFSFWFILGLGHGS